jgi:hypothetical protein
MWDHINACHDAYLNDIMRDIWRLATMFKPFVRQNIEVRSAWFATVEWGRTIYTRRLASVIRIGVKGHVAGSTPLHARMVDLIKSISSSIIFTIVHNVRTRDDSLSFLILYHCQQYHRQKHLSAPSSIRSLATLFYFRWVVKSKVQWAFKTSMCIHWEHHSDLVAQKKSNRDVTYLLSSPIYPSSGIWGARAWSFRRRFWTLIWVSWSTRLTKSITIWND